MTVKSKGNFDTKSKFTRKRSSKNLVINILLSLFSVFIILVGTVMIIGYGAINSIGHEDIENLDNNSSDANLISDSSILNVIIFGSDSRGKDRGRSDSSVLVSVDKKRRKIKVTSLLRDVWVNIPDHSSDRLNAAYSHGGASLAIRTIQDNFGIKIDRYVVVNFEEFKSIIDRLGGIDLELSQDEVDFVNLFSPDGPLINGPGRVHLNGDQALSYSRDRKSAGSDFDRTARQRVVIKTILNKLKTANAVQIVGIISDVCPMITTNFTKSEITAVAEKSLQFTKYDFEEYRLPQSDNFTNEMIDGKSVLVLKNKKKAAYDLAKFVYEDSIVKN